MANASLKLEDFSDRELLWALQDHADSDGFITAEELGTAIGFRGLDNPQRSVAGRLRWMRKYGVVDKEDGQYEEDLGRKGPSRWGLTEAGERLLNAVLTDTEADLLENLSEDQLLVVTQRLGTVMVGSGQTAFTMATRDLRNASATRKRQLAAPTRSRLAA